MEGKAILESEVVRLWQQQVQWCRHLVDSEGGRIEVVYPGRLNDHRGGDFRDAVIVAGQKCQQGCIEVHTLSSRWVNHGHHRDPVYNQVVLHVAYQEDRPGRARREDGQTIPTVILENFLPPQSQAGLPCFGAGKRWGRVPLMEILKKAGERRFQSRAAFYEQELQSSEPEQVLYQGILEALGYSKNKVPFGKLAKLVPLSRVQEIGEAGKPSEEERLLLLQAFLLGSAGLLPSQQPGEIRDSYAARLENIWSGFSPSPAMVRSEWELFKVRPGNYPVRRIVALSNLLQRYRKRGWLRSFTDLVRAAPAGRPAPELEAALMVKADPYWVGGHDFGSRRIAASPFLIGRERAAEIVINILLPFTSAWSAMIGDEKLKRKVSRVYNSYPPGESISIGRHMQLQLGVQSALVSSACCQQGLLQIYKTRCIQGACEECEIIRV